MSGGQLAIQDALEDAVDRSAALLETFAELLQKGLSPNGIELMASTVNGLRSLAVKQGDELRAAFDGLCRENRAAKHRADA